MSRRMVPVVKGDDKIQIVKEAVVGVGRVRCTKCQNLVTPTATAPGKKVLACPVCGSLMTETRI